MTTRNNFDKSSTGTDIEFTGFYDTHLSSLYYRENFETLQESSYRKTSILYFTGGVSKLSELKLTVKGELSAKHNWLVKETPFTFEEIGTWSLDSIDDEILSLNEVSITDYILNEYEANRHQRLPNIAGLTFTPNKNLIITRSHGHSQGDFALIVYCPDDIEEGWGKPPEQGDLQKTIDHYLWDAPVYAVLTINGTEYLYEEDMYTWEREKFIERVAGLSGVEVEALAAIAPKDLSYS